MITRHEPNQQLQPTAKCSAELRAFVTVRRGRAAALGRQNVVNLRFAYLDEHTEAISTLARWHHEAWCAVMPNLTLADRIAGFTARARRGSIPLGLVALLDNLVVGMACLVECDIPSHCHLGPWLATVLVSPDHRRLGIGSALCVRAAAEAQLLGVSNLYLFTFDQQRLYTRLGWFALEDASYAGRSGTVMVQRLAA